MTIPESTAKKVNHKLTANIFRYENNDMQAIGRSL